MSSMKIKRKDENMITVNGYKLSAKDIEEMRDWIADCDWVEDQEYLDELSDSEIVRGVEKTFCGGIEAFLLAA